jgi:hypothetical protein
MATTTDDKLVLLNPTDFIRHVSNVIMLNQREGRDTASELPPIVTRAKNIADRKSLLIAKFEKEN